MSKRVIKRLMAKDGSTYQKDGQTKNGYMECGVVLEDDSGERSYKIKGLPINFDGWLGEWELRAANTGAQAGLNQPQQGYQQAPQSRPQQAPQNFQQPPPAMPDVGDSFDDDIPFS